MPAAGSNQQYQWLPLTSNIELARKYLQNWEPGRHCVILMSDARKHAHLIPITLRLLQAFVQLHALNKYFQVKSDAKSFQDYTGYKCHRKFYMILNRNYAIVYPHNT